MGSLFGLVFVAWGLVCLFAPGVVFAVASFELDGVRMSDAGRVVCRLLGVVLVVAGVVLVTG